MINLLPSEIKQELLLEDRKKILVILGITLVVPLVCFVLILASILFYILGDVNIQKTTVQEAKKQYQTSDFLHFNGIIQKENNNISALNTFYGSQIYYSNVLQSILSVARPSGLYFTDLSLNRGADGKVQVAISGFCQSRDDLLLFQKNLQANQQIQNLSFSPESWVDPQNVTFDVTFEIGKP